MAHPVKGEGKPSIPLKLQPLAPICLSVRLAEPLKLKALQAPGYYALALRAIGQDLANLYPNDLAIEVQADGFMVRGHCLKHRLETVNGKPQASILTMPIGRLFQRAGAKPDPSNDIVEFSRGYSSHDIDRLDQTGAAYRTGMNRIPDPRTLGEALRTIGRLIDGNNCRLTALKKLPDRLIVEYFDHDDQPQREEMTNHELYKLQRAYYGKRGTFEFIYKWKGRET